MASYANAAEVILYHRQLSNFDSADIEARCEAEANRVINLHLGLSEDMETPTPGMILAANRFTAADLLDDLYARVGRGQGGLDGEGGFVGAASNLRKRAWAELRREKDRQEQGESLIQVSDAPTAFSQFDETQW